MKLKEGFVLRQIVDEYLVIPIGTESERMRGIIKLNKVGAELWDLLVAERSEEDLTQYIMKKYSIDEEKAKQDTKVFIDQLIEIGCLSN